MKSITLIFLLILSSHVFSSIDRVTVEADHCTDMVWQGSRQGYFKVREPLFFQAADGLHSLQIVLVREEPAIVWRRPSGGITLRGNYKTIRDFIVHKDQLWLLSGEKLIAFDYKGRIISEHLYGQVISAKDYPHSIVAVEEKFYIAFGAIGLVSFEPASSNFQFVSSLKTLQEKGRSLAVSLAYDRENSQLLVLHTGNSKGAFNGLVSFDLAMGQVSHEFAYDQRKDGVVDRFGKVYVKNSRILLNNGGWIHELKDLSTRRQRPRWLAIRDNSGARQSFVRIRGDFIFSENSLFGCGIIPPKNRGDKRVAKLFSRRL